MAKVDNGPDDQIGVEVPQVEDPKGKARRKIVDSRVVLQVNGRPLKIRGVEVEDHPDAAEYSNLVVTVPTVELADAAPTDKPEGQPNMEGPASSAQA